MLTGLIVIASIVGFLVVLPAVILVRCYPVEKCDSAPKSGAQVLDQAAYDREMERWIDSLPPDLRTEIRQDGWSISDVIRYAQTDTWHPILADLKDPDWSYTIRSNEGVTLSSCTLSLN